MRTIVLTDKAFSNFSNCKSAQSFKCTLIAFNELVFPIISRFLFNLNDEVFKKIFKYQNFRELLKFKIFNIKRQSSNNAKRNTFAMK